MDLDKKKNLNLIEIYVKNKEASYSKDNFVHKVNVMQRNKQII